MISPSLAVAVNPVIVGPAAGVGVGVAGCDAGVGVGVGVAGVGVGVAGVGVGVAGVGVGVAGVGVGVGVSGVGVGVGVADVGVDVGVAGVAGVGVGVAGVGVGVGVPSGASDELTGSTRTSSIIACQMWLTGAFDPITLIRTYCALRSLSPVREIVFELSSAKFSPVVVTSLATVVQSSPFEDTSMSYVSE
jgi:hypothetical protein